MYTGMDLDTFKKKWLKIFAPGVSKQDIQKHYVNEMLWHVFSWELIPADDFAEGEKAIEAFNHADKKDAWYILPFEENPCVNTLTDESITTEELAKETEIYIVANDLSWTYIITHENDWGLGPYFYRPYALYI